MRTRSVINADRLLDSAVRLFGSQRFHEVRMEDIAAEAGVGKGTLYRYFSDKEDLYLALLARASQQVLARLAEAIAGVDGPRQQLIAAVAALIAFFDEQPHLFDLIQRAEVLRDSGRDFPWQEARDELTRLFLNLFKEGQARGEFSIREPELAVLLLLGGLRSVLRFSPQPRAGDLAQRLVSLFLEGAVAQEPSPAPPSDSLP